MSMSFYIEVVLLLVMAASVAYWLQAMDSKDRARAAARRACELDQVQFLDDSVALVRQRLRRDERGRVVLYREFRFEFSVSGAHRYPGMITMMGARVRQCALGPYRDSV